MFTRAQF